MARQKEVYLGHPIAADEPDVRDAIHIAVATVKAGEFLTPGQRIGLSAPGIASSKAEHIGIVDPFLTESVLEGERFHMCLFPYTITSLRHQWTHPKFEEMDTPVVVVREETEEYLEAKLWMENFADRHGSTFDEVMRRCADFVEHGEYWCEGGRFEGEWAPDELWDYYGVLIDSVVPDDKRGGLFSCSC
jgi:hypothetical protein